MQNLKNVFFHWLPLGGAVILASGISFVGVQQIHRQMMNDPQLSIVRDGVIKLEAGSEPVEVVGRGPNINEIIDLENNLSLFVGIYDNKGTPLETNAVLENKPPMPPIGVFEYARTHGEHTVTWQPNSKTRIALVVKSAQNNKGWFVVSGRNMSEDESRIEKISSWYFCGTLFALVITFALDMISDSYRRKVMAKMMQNRDK